MKFMLGTKGRMTQVFDETGRVSAATIISAGPLTVTQVKNAETDGYEAVQVGFGEKAAKNIAKAQQGHFKDLGLFRFVREFRVAGMHQRGDTIDITSFAPGDIVTVSATTKGKGFQGVVKRHDFRGMPRTHGTKHTERSSGSIGAGGFQRVFKGKRMAGRMGGERVTVKNLKVLQVIPETNTLLISGAIPGHPGALVEIVSNA
ncbi:MAG TPA: 50S ribosomal protein L3 [Candidatus Paceibacterota bacterium]|nr:50S ribosomal protein L3 [Candidatus Paceibacterota bacterium]